MASSNQPSFQAVPVITGNIPGYMNGMINPPQQQQQQQQTFAQQQAIQQAPTAYHMPPRGQDGKFLPFKTEKEHETHVNNPNAMSDAEPPLPNQQQQQQPPAQQQQQQPPVQQQQQQQQPPAQQQQQDPGQSWLLKAAQQGQGATFSPEELDQLRHYLKATTAQNQDLATKAQQLESAKQALDKQQKSAKDAVVQSLKDLVLGFAEEGKPVPKERIDAWSSAITGDNMNEFVMNISNDLVAASSKLRHDREQLQRLMQQQQQQQTRVTPVVAPQLTYYENQYQPAQTQPQQPRYDESFLRSVSNFLGPQQTMQAPAPPQMPQQQQWVAANKRSRSEFEAGSNQARSSFSSSPWDISSIDGINCTAQDAAVFESVMAKTRGMNQFEFEPTKYYSQDALKRMSAHGGFGANFGQDSS